MGQSPLPRGSSGVRDVSRDGAVAVEAAPADGPVREGAADAWASAVIESRIEISDCRLMRFAIVTRPWQATMTPRATLWFASARVAPGSSHYIITGPGG